jgi:NAD(P)-dependent dehydrogenase (short-subunit alcohol dehydrogenase family)
MGVLHGVRTFLPHIRSHGEGGHFVNTASMAGLNTSPYSASKFAVVNISEGLPKQIAPLGIGVTIVCPGFVRTRISGSARNRQQRFGKLHIDPASPAGKHVARQAELAQARNRSCRCCGSDLRAIKENELYVFTHAGREWRDELSERFDRVLAAFDAAAARRSNNKRQVDF